MEKEKLNRCMFTKTEIINKVNSPRCVYQKQCENMTNKQPDPSNNNRVYCDSCQEIVDKINKEKFKGYVKISKLKKYFNEYQKDITFTITEIINIIGDFE